MNRFKVGDRVRLTERCNGGDHVDLVNKIATVVKHNHYTPSINEEHFEIRWEHNNAEGSWLARGFDLEIEYTKDSLYA